MRCNQVSPVDFLRQNLSPAEVTHMLTHIEACLVCQGRLQVTAALEAGGCTGKGIRWRWLALAASLAVAVIWSLSGTMKEVRTPAELASLQPYPLVQLVTRSSAVPTLSQEVLDAYRGGDYATVVQLLEQDPLDSTQLFVAGVCLYLENKNAAARRHLARGLALSSLWQQPSQWYLANIELRSHRPAAALPHLTSLAGEPGRYQNRARSLLQQLEQLR